MEPGDSSNCPLHEQITALGRGDSGFETSATDARLEQDPRCRDCFRHACVGRFPEIPSYTVIRQIGKGGFGVVYKVIHHAKERVEALKLLSNATPLISSYFENEVHLIARLQHPNIATLYEAQLNQQPLYYTMEYVDGVRLNDYLANHPCTVEQRIRILVTVARALHYAHEHHVVHRDIKPQNVLIDADGRPHIVDFGIAKRLNVPAGTVGHVEGWLEGPIGTRGYIAPEQAQGDEVDARADIFALGALLFHSISGEPAGLARDATRRRRAIERLGLRHVRDLDAIIRRCVATQPKHRYADCAALADDLEAYVRGRPVAARAGSGPLYRANRLLALLVREHQRRIIAVGLAVLVCLLTVTGWGLSARRLAAPPPGGETVLIGFGPETLRALAAGAFQEIAPQANALNRKSWRTLHGALLERLAETRPRVIAFDYYFPDPRPTYDAALVRGGSRLAAPLIFGARIDAHGRPEIAASLLPIVDDVAPLIANHPDNLPDEFEVVHALERGFEPARAGLALRAFAAARFPDCVPVIQRDSNDRNLRIAYRLRDEQAAGLRWKLTTDAVPLTDVREVGSTDGGIGRAGDRLAIARVPSTSIAAWDNRTIPYEQVLRADATQLRRWFDGRAIVVGQMLPGQDQYDNGRGDALFGCHVHAAALDALLSARHTERISRGGLFARHLGWAALAALWIAVATPPTRARQHHLALLAALVIGAGLFVTAATAATATQPWLVESGLAAGALLATGGFGYWMKASRALQLRGAPGAITPGEPSTLAGSALATPATITPATGSTWK